MAIQFDDLIQGKQVGTAPRPKAGLAFDDLVPEEQTAPQQTAGQPTSILPGGEPMEPGLGRDLTRLAGSFSQGANEGLISLLELPYDALNNAPRLLNLLPGVESGSFGTLMDETDPGVNLFRALGPDRVEAETPTERVTERVGNEFGMSLVPQAALTLRAAKLPAGINAANKMSGADRAFTLPFRDAPGKTNLMESGAAVGAGIGAGTAAEQFGEGTLSELLGAILGGTSTSVGMSLADGTARTGRSLVTDAPVRQETGSRLLNQATDPEQTFSQTTRNRAVESAEAIPGVELTLGQASGDSGTLATEYARSQSGPGMGDFNQRRVENNAAVDSAFNDVAPDAATDTAAREALEARRRSREATAGRVTQGRQAVADEAGAAEADLRTQRDSAEGEFNAEFEDAASQRDLKEVGSEGVSEAFTSARDRVSNERRQAFDEAQELGTTPVDSTPFQDEAQAILDDIGPLADSNDPALMRLVRDIEDLEPGSGVTVGELVDMQPRLSRAMKNANSAMRGDTVRQLGRLNEKMRTALNDLADSGDEGALKWREANQLSREEAPLFRTGKGGQMDKKARKGEATADSAAGGEFLGPDKAGRPETLKQLRQIIDKSADPDAAQQSVRAYMVGSLADNLSGRKPSVEAVDSFIRKHSQVLREFPDVNKEVTQMRNQLQSKSTKIGALEEEIAQAAEGTKTAQTRADRSAKLEKNQSARMNSRKSTVGRYLEKETGAESMGLILSATKPRREAERLMGLVKGNKDAEEGVRRAFFDNTERSVKSTTEDAASNALYKKDAFQKFMNKNSDVADIVLGKQHSSDLRRIANELNVLQRTTNAKPAGSSGTAAGNKGTGISLNSVLSRLYGIQRGVVSTRFVASEMATRVINSAVKKMRAGDIDRLLDEALLDPELARTLAMEASKENDRILSRRMPALLGRLGARSGRAKAATDIPPVEADAEEDEES